MKHPRDKNAVLTKAYEQVFSFFRNWKGQFAIILLIIVLIVFHKIALVVLFIILGGLSQIYKRVISFPLGLELLTFFTVVIAYWLNPLIAWFCAMIMVSISLIADPTMAGAPHRYLKYTIISILILFIGGLDIARAGIIAAIVANVVQAAIAFGIHNVGTLWMVPSWVINILLNIFLFTQFSQKLLNALTFF